MNLLCKRILTTMGAGLAVFACSQKKESDKPMDASTVIARDIRTDEFRSLMQSGQSYILIDVRTDAEVAEGKIEGAIHIDYRSKVFESEIGKLDRQSRVLVYCRSGSRSFNAMTSMKRMGFAEVYNLAGGIIGWQAAGLPVVK